jgi:hypothetical protein
MLLSYKGKTTVSTSRMQIRKSTSTDDDYDITEMPLEKNSAGEIISEVLTDESPKSFWVAEADDSSQWVKIEMLKPGKIYAFQLNYHDHETGIYTRVDGLRHRFTIEVSEDGETWQTVVDRSNSWKDSPNAYMVLSQPVEAKFVRYKNIEVPGPNLAMSEIRVFGLGLGEKPAQVKGFKVKRETDRRDATISWDPVKGAQGYNIRWGIAPGKLYHSWLVYDDTDLLMRNLDKNTSYSFTIEAFNENGISAQSKIIRIE